MQTSSRVPDISVSAIKADAVAKPSKPYAFSLSTMILPHAFLAYASFFIFLFMLPIFMLMFIGDLPGKLLWKKQSADAQSFTAEHVPEPLRDKAPGTTLV